MNELLWLIQIVTIFVLVVLSYRLFGKQGLILWIPLSVIVANIQVVQTVRLFGFSCTLGNVAYSASFLITDILSENHGRKEAQRAVWMGFFSLLCVTLLMHLTLQFQPLAGDADSAAMHAALTRVFSLLPRIALASLIAYLVSQRHDVWAFQFWKTRFPGSGKLWLRNNLSTMVSQLIDSILFVLIAFWGVFEAAVLWEVLITTYILKWVVAAADTPFVYWAGRIERRRSHSQDGHRARHETG